MYATEELKEKAIAQSGLPNLFETNFWVNFAYTDYGGTFFDKVCIEYFERNFPNNFVSEVVGWNGKNGVLFNTSEDTNLVEDFREKTGNYLLGFADLEDFYSQMEYEQTTKDFEWFLEDLQREYFVKKDTLDFLLENYSGHFEMQPNGLDFCYSDLEKELKEENLIFSRYGNDFLEDLLVIFEDKQLETELSKENNILFESIEYNFYFAGKYLSEDLKSIENFFSCTFYLHDNGNFCVNWKN